MGERVGRSGRHTYATIGVLDCEWRKEVYSVSLLHCSSPDTGDLPMTLQKRDTDFHTYAEYLTWPDSRNDELIDGVAYVREPPAPAWTHQRVVGEVYHQIASALEDKPGYVCVAPVDVRLAKGTEDDGLIATVVQPDVLIVCDPQKIDPLGVRGAPDWVGEVLSPSTASYDRTVKVPVYERAGVREVWLIDPANLTTTIYRLEAGRYADPIRVELKGRTSLTAVPGVTIDWNRLLAKI